MDRNSVVGTTQRAGWSGGSNPDRGKKFFSSKFPDLFWGPPSHRFIGCLGTFLQAKRPVRYDNHTTRSNSDVKNEWSYNFIPAHAFINRRGTTLCT